MALNTNVPLPTQSLGQTWNLINQNFNNIQAAFVVNHVDYAIGDAGKHKFVTMPVQAGAPGTTTTEMALYTKLVAGNPQMFIQRQQTAGPTAGVEINFTSAVTGTNNDTTTLPSGVILKWGTGTTAGTGLATVNFTTAFPNAVLSMNATMSIAGGASGPQVACRVYSYTVNGFSVQTWFTSNDTNAALSFSWFAIGN
jgi:hypothetical protein